MAGWHHFLVVYRQGLRSLPARGPSSCLSDSAQEGDLEGFWDGEAVLVEGWRREEEEGNREDLLHVQEEMRGLAFRTTPQQSLQHQQPYNMTTTHDQDWFQPEAISCMSLLLSLSYIYCSFTLSLSQWSRNAIQHFFFSTTTPQCASHVLVLTEAGVSGGGSCTWTDLIKLSVTLSSNSLWGVYRVRIFTIWCTKGGRERWLNIFREY